MNNVENIYNKICNDKKIIERYEEIEKFEEVDGRWAYHNFEHVKNVTSIVDEILSSLDYENDFISAAKIACLLHDTGALEGKEGHACRSYEYATQYFKDNDIVFDNADLVLEAIKNHSDGFDTDNVIALSLILADKLDIKKTRISNEGKKVEGNRQYTHIEDITLEIKDESLFVRFTTDNEMDLKEVNEFYFTKKVFKAVEAFANKLNLSYVILLDNKCWEI